MLQAVQGGLPQGKTLQPGALPCMPGHRPALSHTQREWTQQLSHLELKGHRGIQRQDEQIRAGVLRHGRHSFRQLLHSLLSMLCTVSQTPAMHARAQAACCRSMLTAYKAACSMQMVQYVSV